MYGIIPYMFDYWTDSIVFFYLSRIAIPIVDAMICKPSEMFYYFHKVDESVVEMIYLQIVLL